MIDDTYERIDAMLASRVSQREFAQIIGTDEAVVSRLVRRGILPREGTVGDWLRRYTRRLRAQGRARAGGSELGQARLRLANASADRAEAELSDKVSALVWVGHLEPALRSISAQGLESLERTLAAIQAQIEARHGITLDAADIRDPLRDYIQVLEDLGNAWRPETGILRNGDLSAWPIEN